MIVIKIKVLRSVHPEGQPPRRVRRVLDRLVAVVCWESFNDGADGADDHGLGLPPPLFFVES